MNRDALIQTIVAAEAQLRRLEQLARIKDPVEYRARMVRLISQSRALLRPVVLYVNQTEGA